MKRILLSIFALTSACFASMEYAILPDYVHIVIDGGTRGQIELKANADEGIIEKIDFFYDEEWHEVPKTAFEDLEAVLLHTLQVRFETGNDVAYIYFETSYRDASGAPNPKGIHISFEEGKFTKRSIMTPNSGGSIHGGGYTYESKEL
ncbi:hypothetical protein [Pelagicoccus sp. SDUM812002]|uniref:hypothetical protein n=1 Tax=Pelagicoccus sp. SDUM812002 TaxID=3041266 RepID=UPI00280E6BE2|nr:hypothetical protein [Pelagicoccus sp. SDUM812002]MDQ8188528.1 hypothetical protein [Pelagicoccus sp. SDUM812002]